MRKGEKSTKGQSAGLAESDKSMIRDLSALLDETGLSEIEYSRDGWHVRVSNRFESTSLNNDSSDIRKELLTDASPVIAAAKLDPSEDQVQHSGTIFAPMVGIVYTAAEPDSPNFVNVGDHVEEGDTILLIEAMKVFNPIRAPKSGVISKIFINNGKPVEYGEPLLILE